jgi:hypothetical protein
MDLEKELLEQGFKFLGIYSFEEAFKIPSELPGMMLNIFPYVRYNLSTLQNSDSNLQCVYIKPFVANDVNRDVLDFENVIRLIR